MSSRFFADLSSNNHTFDARAYRKAGHLVVAIKATEGLGFVDAPDRARVHEAHDAGVKVIHYHFGRPDLHPDGRSEARAFWAQVRPLFRRGDRLALDLEKEAPGVNMSVYAANFMDEVRKQAKASGVKLRHWLWLYTFTSFYREHGLRLPWHSLLWLADFGAPILGRRAGLPRIFAHQFTDGVNGPPPHALTGTGASDVNKLSMRAWLLLRLRWRVA